MEIQGQQNNTEEGYVFEGIMDDKEAENNQQIHRKCQEDEKKRNFMKYDIAEIIGDRINGPEGDNSETIVEQQWMKYLHTLNIFWEMCSGIRESVNLIALTYKKV